MILADSDIASRLAWRRRRNLQLNDASQTAASVGGAAGAALTPMSPARAIFVGTTTGVLVWCITRFLDKVLR